uniref:Uncharacterized protein n=1 Tax=Ditylum brightwellii TaxID=49249 RepID=A0A6S9HJS8_9STRA|mmetsp:Transcript_146/g.273  ORF Transcript_146/g.273 Transcript_146/m.273 type:complete len:186 (+) Transcript_146:143-700(+)
MTCTRRTRLLLVLASFAVFGGQTLVSGEKRSRNPESRYQSGQKNFVRTKITAEGIEASHRRVKSGKSAKSSSKSHSRKYEDIEDEHEMRRSGKGSKSSSKASRINSAPTPPTDSPTMFPTASPIALQGDDTQDDEESKSSRSSKGSKNSKSSFHAHTSRATEHSEESKASLRAKSTFKGSKSSKA